MRDAKAVQQGTRFDFTIAHPSVRLAQADETRHRRLSVPTALGIGIWRNFLVRRRAGVRPIGGRCDGVDRTSPLVRRRRYTPTAKDLSKSVRGLATSRLEYMGIEDRRRTCVANLFARARRRQPRTLLR